MQQDPSNAEKSFYGMDGDGIVRSKEWSLPSGQPECNMPLYNVDPLFHPAEATEPTWTYCAWKPAQFPLADADAAVPPICSDPASIWAVPSNKLTW
jgi:hypothetical protein